MPDEDDIFENLQSGYEGVGEFYDLFADNSDIPFYLEYANRVGSPILDVAAGSGRVSIPLAKAGFKVVALEESESMIQQAKRRIEALSSEVGRRITLVRGSMIDFALNQKFSLVIIPNSFGHALTTEAQLSTLACIRQHLAPDGIFILDLFPGAIQHNQARFRDNPVSIEGGRTVARSGLMRLDPVRQLLRVDLEYTVLDAEGDVEKKLNVISGAAIIYNREADLLVKQSGLEVVREYGSFKLEPYSHKSSHRILILKRSREE